MAGANSNIQLTGLDFDAIKFNLKTYLQSQEILKDANYEGSVLSTLLDILAYNTHYNAHYLNMVANEMFLDTSVKRSSVISHAKELGYHPYSFSAPTAEISVYFTGVTVPQIVIPKYTKFLSNIIDGVTYPFVTLEDYILVNDGSGNASVENFEIKQGEPLAYSFVYNQTANPSGRFKIPNSNIDLSTLKVLVQNSSTDIRLQTYNYPDDMLALDSTSLVYFIQETFDGFYEIYFGDGVLGKQLTDGNVVLLSYLSVSSSVLQNIDTFTLVSSAIGDYAAVNVVTVAGSGGGRYKESIQSIKNIAPKAYQAQERAVSINDYIALIQKNSGIFPIDAVNVWSGEQNYPPIYGRVFVSVKPKGKFAVTPSQKNLIKEQIIRPISMLTVEPVVIDVDYSFLNVKNTILYDKSKTVVGPDQLRINAISAIRNYATDFLNTFNSTLVLSDLTRYVNDSNPAIITNESTFYLEKRFTPALGISETYNFDYGVPIKKDFSRKAIRLSPSFQIFDSINNITRTEVFLEEVPTSSTSVESISIVNPGYGYTSAPTVTISGDGTGAIAEAIISNGQIEKINIINAGINYTQATISISGGGGLLGSASVTLQNQYGTLRTYYFANGIKIILNPNAGTVDYYNGKISLVNFNPSDINNPLAQLSLYIIPDTTIISSEFNRMIVMDNTDPNAISINITAK